MPVCHSCLQLLSQSAQCVGRRRILGLLPREQRWRARLVCRAMRAAVHGMPDLAFWLALTAGPLSGSLRLVAPNHPS